MIPSFEGLRQEIYGNSYVLLIRLINDYLEDSRTSRTRVV